ncbi:MAG: helix-turn-helix transcriptional regulator, partial [Spirochaetaceae bacterium]|nr:helix-turn-helix transcriptional regulator [Spirochaetaceae bacterium]
EMVIISQPYIQDDKEIDSLHFHDSLEIGYCLSGYGIFNINNQPSTFESGDVVVIPPGNFHLASSSKETISKWIWIYIKEALYEEYGQMIQGVFPNFKYPQLNDEVKKLAFDGQEPLRLQFKKRISGRVHIILSECVLLSKKNNRTDIHSKKSKLVLRAIEVIHNNYCNDINVGTIADLCNISQSGLYKRFKKELYCCPKTYLDRYRVRMSCSVLKNRDITFLETALSLGFGSLSSFNRIFKKEMGTSPGQWLKNEWSSKGNKKIIQP